MTPLATAQTPEASTLSVTSGGHGTVSVEEPADLQFTVTFESQNPLDTQNPRDIHLELDALPAGWTASIDPQSLSMVSGASQTVTVTVAVSTQHTGDGADVTLRALLVPYGLNPVPGVGEAFDPAATAEDSARVTVDESLTRGLLEGLGNWIWFLLVAILALAGLAGKLIADARRQCVAMVASKTQVELAPGKNIAVPISVENLCRSEDTVVFHVASVAKGWSASLPVPELDLDGGATEEMQLIIAAPKDAVPGETQVVGLSAHSAQAPRRVAEAVITITVVEP